MSSSVGPPQPVQATRQRHVRAWNAAGLTASRISPPRLTACTITTSPCEALALSHLKGRAQRLGIRRRKGTIAEPDRGRVMDPERSPASIA